MEKNIIALVFNNCLFSNLCERGGNRFGVSFGHMQAMVQ